VSKEKEREEKNIKEYTGQWKGKNKKEMESVSKSQ
jgi:hypothetical protein